MTLDVYKSIDPVVNNSRVYLELTIWVLTVPPMTFVDQAQGCSLAVE